MKILWGSSNIFQGSLKILFGSSKVFKDPQKMFEDPQRTFKDPWRSSKILARFLRILARFLRILARFLRICKDLGNVFWGSSLRSLRGSLKIFMKIFEDPQRSLQDFHQGVTPELSRWKQFFHKQLWLKVERCRNMQLFGNGYYGEPPENQSHHREMIVPLYWAKEVTSSSLISSLLLLERKTQVLHSEAQWLISNKVCKLFWK